MAKLLGAEKFGHRLDRYWLHTDDTHKDVITVETSMDVEPILNANQREFNSATGRFGDGWTRVARIPDVVLEEFCRLNKIKFREFMLAKTDRAQKLWNRLLNDPAFCKLRTAPGRVDIARRA